MYLFRYIVLFILTTLQITAIGQNLNQGKRLFAEEKYKEAKPIFEKAVKKNPRNGSLNYWYGVCCYHTEEGKKALPYLKYAASRKVREAHRYMAMYYEDNYMFADAQQAWDSYFEEMKKAQKPIDSYQERYERTVLGKQMMRAIQDIVIIDSIVMDKSQFLKAYHLSKENGKLSTFNDFFERKDQPDGVVFMTEMENRIFYGAKHKEDSVMKLYSSDLINGEWTTGKPLTGIDSKYDTNFPYMASDGCIFYFAANNKESLGGYDIFITRYDSENDEFLIAENIGMPFNSPYNDYMYVIDEFNNLGWFASDRHQENNKVCIYTFIPNNEVKRLKEEEVEPALLRSRAQLTSIRQTWKDQQTIDEAKKRLENSINMNEDDGISKGDSFIINDLISYHKAEEFHSAEARNLYKKWVQENNYYNTILTNLSQKRDTYSKGNKQIRQKMESEIFSLEKRAEELHSSLKELEKRIRNSEILFLNKMNR